MLKIRKKKDGQQVFYEEKPELKGIDLIAQNIKNQIGDSSDIVFRELYVNGNEKLPVTFIFVDGLINDKNMDDDILKPLLQERVLSCDKDETEVINYITKGGLYHNSAKIRDKIDETIEDILNGYCALIFDKERKAVTFSIRGYEKRAISEPTGENVIKGAKDSFIEELRVNTSRVRRKIKTQNLKIRQTKIGQQTLTDVAVLWIEGIANDNIVQEVFKRLEKINHDGVVLAGSIEDYIIDNRWNPYPQVYYTERPDRFCKGILDGRVGIIIDGLPVTYIVPAEFNMFLKAPEDYSNNYLIASLVRLMRFAAFFFTLMLPAFYISVTTFHHEMIPTDLVVSIVKSKEGVPFPTFIEVLGMLFAFELLIEAGLRLPKTIGQAVSIIGAVVVGQAAVSAKIISPGVVIIVALAGIAGFTMPNQDFSNAVRIWRFIIVISASFAGLFSLVIGLIVMGYQLVKQESYGVPYFSPFTSNEGREIMQDTLFRFPFSFMKKRPSSLKTKNKLRQKGD